MLALILLLLIEQGKKVDLNGKATVIISCFLSRYNVLHFAIEAGFIDGLKTILMKSGGPTERALTAVDR